MRPAITSTIESTLTALTSSPERVTEGKEQECQLGNLISPTKSFSPRLPSLALMATLPITTLSLFPRALDAYTWVQKHSFKT